MPHLILEYSNNLPEPLDHQMLFAELHTALAHSGLFALPEIKSRAIPHDLFRVGSGLSESIFVHLTVAILSGRDLSVRQTISADLLAVLRRAFASVWRQRPCDLTVDIREIERATYAKAMNDAARDVDGGPGKAINVEGSWSLRPE